MRRRLLRRYRRRSREVVVDDRFRGWAWEVPPVDPPYDYQLALSELASRYCESMRDIYLRHVEKKRKPTNAKMIEGGLYHSVIASAVQNAKRELYNMTRASGHELGVRLVEMRDQVIDDMIKTARRPEVVGRGGTWDETRVRSNMEWLWDYEASQMVATVDRVLAAQPYIGTDALVHSAVPVVVEQKLDGRNIGLSGQLSADAFGMEGVVLDTKTGERRQFHRFSTTGYAMVIESIYEYPVDVGCIVYCWFRKPVPPTIEYDIHQIDEPLRQEFLELRDEAMRLIYNQRDPGMPALCYEDCPYWEECH
ncbi:MAG: type I-A CRISPR-associated protein Cas4/Csa1 [Candidatus Thorarchaeota archaeon]|nr:type I-A CRISPR-associated protein Cas4/Csa1 [Candidatus Thorarchaeota archaeon]